MKASVRITSIIVRGESKEDCYIKGCKKLANVASKENITFSVENVKDDERALRFNIFTNIDMNGMQKDFCKMCKQFHCSFYVNEDYNCSRCNLKAYIQRLQHTVNVSKSYYKSNLKID